MAPKERVNEGRRKRFYGPFINRSLTPPVSPYLWVLFYCPRNKGAQWGESDEWERIFDERNERLERIMAVSPLNERKRSPRKRER